MQTKNIKIYFRSFRFSNKFSQIAIFRYNRDVDQFSQILFNSFTNDEAGLLQAFNRIPYDGSGKF